MLSQIYDHSNRKTISFRTSKPMLRQLDTIICAVTVIHFLLFAFFLLYTGKNRHISSRVFAFFLLSEALTIGSFLLIRNLNSTDVKLTLLLYVIASCQFLKGPLLYFYTRSLTNRLFRPRPRDAVHLLPVAAQTIFATSLFFRYFGDTSGETFRQRVFSRSPEWMMIDGAMYVLILGYIIASYGLLRKYIASLRETLSYLERISLPWLKFILHGFTALWAMWTANYLCVVFASRFFPWLDLVAMTLFFITANVIIFNGLHLPELFTGIEEKVKYKDSPLTMEEKKRYIDKLLDYMSREKPYLNPALSLSELAIALAIAPRHLSQVINENFKQNFYDFVNSYRIEDAKLYLMDGSRNRTVLEILYEVGFNSKSAFNLAFKTQTGLTPTEFRKKPFSAIPV